MKQLSLMLFALSVWGQSPPTTTVADTIYTGVNGGTISGRLQITSPERTYNGQPLILPAASIPIVNGAFTVNLVPNDVTLPSSTYTVEIYATYSPRPIMVQSWFVTTSATTLKLVDVVQRRTTAPPDFPMLSLFQISVTGSTITDCIGSDGTKAVWKPCGTGGGGSPSWNGLIGVPTDNSALMALFAAKASTSHASSHVSAGSDPLTLDLSQVGGLLTSLAGKVDGLSSVTDGQMLQFNGTGGKIIKASSLTGVLKATGGVPSAVPGTSSDCVKVDGSSGACGGSVTGGDGTVATGDSVAVDPLTVARYATSSGVPSGTFAAGSLFATNILSGDPYWAIAANTFARLAKYTDLPGLMGGDTGSGGTAGLVPAPAAGDAAAAKYLKADGTWAVPAGSGGGSTTGLYSGTIDFGSIPDGACSGLTFTATGITTGKALALSLPSGWETGLIATAFVSAADTVKVRACNFSGAAVDPASATFKVRDLDSLGYLTASATINFSSIPDGGCAASTITLSGAAAGDNVAPGWPSALETGLTGAMFVSATDTVAVRLCNWSGAAVDPASGTFKAAITR